MHRPMVQGLRIGDPECMKASPTSDTSGTRKRAGLLILPALLGGAGAVLLAAGRWGGLAWALLITAVWLLAVTAEAGPGRGGLRDRRSTELRRAAASTSGGHAFVETHTRNRDEGRRR